MYALMTRGASTTADSEAVLLKTYNCGHPPPLHSPLLSAVRSHAGSIRPIQMDHTVNAFDQGYPHRTGQ